MPFTASGTLVGYDPGGNDKHGLALLSLRNGQPTDLRTRTCANAEAVIRALEACDDVVGLGLDTMTCWSTGKSGYRPADRWIREQYPDILNSVVSPNGMYGSMGINGMSVALWAADHYDELYITETHPKALYYAVSDEKYDYESSSDTMHAMLASHLEVEVASITNDHEWDAALSTLAVLRGLDGAWSRDLHALDASDDETLIEPAGLTRYVWPG